MQFMIGAVPGESLMLRIWSGHAHRGDMNTGEAEVA